MKRDSTKRKTCLAAVLTAACLMLAPSLAGAQVVTGGAGECDPYRGRIPNRPDCLPYNPYYSPSGGTFLATPATRLHRSYSLHRRAYRRRR